MNIATLILLFSSALTVAQEVKPFAPEIFSPAASGAVCGFSANGKTMYFVREDTLADKLFIYKASLKGNIWTDVEVLPFSGQHNDMGGRLTVDNRRFYFTSDRPGGSQNAEDVWNIWVSENTNGGWSEATPLLDLNNKGSECCPVPLPDGSIMFSSDRPDYPWWVYSWDESTETSLDMLSDKQAWQWPSSYVSSEKLLLFNSMIRKDSKGMDDVYVAFLHDGQWTAPVNIGAPVNTGIYEDGAILSPDERLLIFNRHETGMTPSQVMCVEWKPILKELKEGRKG
jgi:hypothetical protein